jgi:adenylate kinase
MDASRLQRPLRLALLGGPGVGKGTQAELLKARLNVTHFSTGEMFRAIAKSGAATTPAVQEALAAMTGGKLVPDAITIALVGEHLDGIDAAKGILFDGFPRTLPQAEALDTLLAARGTPLDAVLNFEVERGILIERLSGRRTCGKCGASYHVVFVPPKVEGVCDACGAALVQREDDRPAAIEVRLETYEKNARPLIAFYAAGGRLVTVDADAAPEAVAERGLAALGAFLKG